VTNARGLVIREEVFGGDFAIVREYDQDEYLLSETNAAGETARFEYDARGNLVRHVDPAATRPRGTSWTTCRGAARSPGSGGSARHRIPLDGHGALSGVRLPTGATLHYRYDGAGRVVEVAGPEGLLVSVRARPQHNLVAERNARGALTRYRYDALGRPPVEKMDALGARTTSHLRRPRPAPGGAAPRRHGHEEHVRSARIARELRTDPLDKTTRLDHAGTGVLVGSSSPDGQTYRFRYDEDERLRRVENPRAEQYTFDHDWAGRVVRERTFDARWIEYQYNKASRLTRIQYGKDDWRAFSYDPLGNVIEDRCPDGGTVLARDAQGRLRKRDRRGLEEHRHRDGGRVRPLRTGRRREAGHESGPV
jgi:YD repeat-containing protein